MNAIEKYEVALTALERGLMSLDDFEKEIAPLRDVVPVVRCGQCKYWQDNDSDHDYGYCYAKDGHGFGHVWGKNDFCSYGEREE